MNLSQAKPAPKQLNLESLAMQAGLKFNGCPTPADSFFLGGSSMSILRRTAAEIAAAAVYELYPEVELLGGDETPTGFFYDFHTPHPIHAQAIEERMRQIVKEKRPIRTLEMVAFSASELLKKEGHLSRAEELEDGLVELIEIGPFHDLSAGPHLKNTAELAAFKTSVESLPDQATRIVGWCHTSKEGLKHFLKKLKSYAKPLQLGEKKGYWIGPVWLPEGLRLRQKLIHFLKEQWFTGAFEILAPPQADRLTLHRSLGKPKVAEISPYGPQGTQIQISFFDKPAQELISLLQSIGKTLTILGFDHSTVSMGPETDYVIEDGLGRSWPVVQVKRISRKGSSTVDFIFTTEVERVFHLLLEKNLLVNVENK